MTLWTSKLVKRSGQLFLTRSVSLPASCSPFFARFDSCANLRLLYGARHPDAPAPLRPRTFQSTRPVWGATRRRGRKTIFAQFQSTRPRGARRPTTRPDVSNVLFQSTRPRGARPASAGVHKLQRHFNPRARVGRDGACLHGLNYSGRAVFFANLIFGRAVTGIFRRKVLCVIRVRTEILRPFLRRRCLLQHQSSFSFITWFCTDVLRFSCVFIS